MRLMIVGGGQGQLRAIRQAKESGIETVVSDLDPHAPGLKEAHIGVVADTFDPEATIEAARKYRVDGITTLGTDQPVMTVTRAAEGLGLPHALSVEQALRVTNKRFMKVEFDRLGIPHNPYRIISSGFKHRELAGLCPPFVLKPVDSQGQRGVVRLDDPRELSRYLPETLGFSREGFAVVEEFYESDEVTFSGWVREGRVYPLTITDRRSVPHYPHIGVCVAHTYPSRHFARYGDEVLRISHGIVEGLGIRQGPLYFQMLIGKDGVRVNEIACRIGGAYEDEFIPALTGVDLNLLNFRESLGQDVGDAGPEGFPYPADGAVAVLLFFTEALTVEETAPIEATREIPGVLNARYLVTRGRKIGPIHNSTGRAGYVIVRGETSSSVNHAVREAYGRLGVFDAHGKNRLIDYSAESMLK